MPIMCATIYAKGTVMRNFDAYFAKPQKVPFNKLINQLSDPSISFTKVFRKQNVLSAIDAKHMNKHWFSDEPPGYWPLHRGKENILKQGAIRALNCAKNKKQPIVSSWICTGGQWQVIVEQSANQVNMLIATPPPPTLPEEASHTEEIWISGSPDAIAMVRTPYVENWSGQGEPPPNYEPTPFNDVAEVQMKGN